MKDNKGFIELINVKDYWKKLQFDFTELKKNDENIYVAFNFFVTSYHLLDWIFEGKYNNDRKILNNKPILKLCSHIANGIKHFETNSDRHNSVKEIEKNRYVEEDYCEEDYVESQIIIFLDEILQPDFGKSIKIIELANIVMTFWESELIKRKLI